MVFVYDAAVLIAADQGDRRVWSAHGTRVGSRATILVPSPVVAQVSRSTSQAELRRFLAACRVVPFGERDAHEAGRLLGLTRTTAVADAAVVVAALNVDSPVIVTGDPRDIRRLIGASGYDIGLQAV